MLAAYSYQLPLCPNATCFLPSTKIFLLLSFSTAILLLGVAFIGLMVYVFRTHNAYFGGKRLSRNNSMSPSSYQLDPPKVRSWEPHNEYGNLEKQLPENNKLHPNLFTPTVTTTTSSNDKKSNAATELNMDHIYVSYFQLLWAFIFIGPFSYFLWKKASLMLKLRLFLVKAGVSKVASVDMDALVGKIVLEQSQVIHYVSRTNMGIRKRKSASGGSENEDTATFIFPGKHSYMIILNCSHHIISFMSSPCSITHYFTQTSLT